MNELKEKMAKQNLGGRRKKKDEKNDNVITSMMFGSEIKSMTSYPGMVKEFEPGTIKHFSLDTFNIRIRKAFLFIFFNYIINNLFSIH